MTAKDIHKEMLPMYGEHCLCFTVQLEAYTSPTAHSSQFHIIHDSSGQQYWFGNT
jgi:hypothetical protein